MKVTQFHRDEKTGRIELHLDHDDDGNGSKTTFEDENDLMTQAKAGAEGMTGTPAEVALFLQAVGADLIQFIDIPPEKINAIYEIIPAEPAKVQEKK